MSPSSPSYSNQAYPFPASQAPIADSSSFQPINAYSTGADPNPPSWGYPGSAPTMDRTSQYPPPALPSIHSLERNPSSSGGGPPSAGGAPGYGTAAASSGTAPGDSTSANANNNNTTSSWNLEASVRDDTEGGGGISYRTWPQEASYSSMDGNAVSHPSSSGSVEASSSLRGPHGSSSSNPDLRENYASLPPPAGAEPYAQNRYSQEPYTPITQHATPQQLDTSMYASASYAQQQQQQHQQQQQSQSQTSYHHPGSYTQDPTPPSTIPPLPKHTYTRTLVGPLSANACRLLDEHRKPGIFFLFQDLSIRTEGG